jgi:predicted membrane GTPase involved in stress response
VLFVQPGQDVYKGQIVGIHQRPGDLAINVCKKKAATNVRSNKETTGNNLFSLSTWQFDGFLFSLLPDLQPFNSYI